MAVVAMTGKDRLNLVLQKGGLFGRQLGRVRVRLRKPLCRRRSYMCQKARKCLASSQKQAGKAQRAKHSSPEIDMHKKTLEKKWRACPQARNDWMTLNAGQRGESRRRHTS